MAIIKRWDSDADWNTGIPSGNPVISGGRVMLDEVNLMPCTYGRIYRLDFDTGENNKQWTGIELDVGWGVGTGDVKKQVAVYFYADQFSGFPSSAWRRWFLKYTDNPTFESTLPIILGNDRLGNPFVGRWCRVEINLDCRMYYGYETNPP
jgi:hypothetical protein